MCLDYAYLTTIPPRKGVGWKHFRKKRDGTYAFQFRDYKGSVVVPLNKWIKAKPTILKAVNNKSLVTRDYKSGFHIYTKEDTPRYSSDMAMVKVFYEEATIRGRQHVDQPCVVAQWMYVPTDQTMKTPPRRRNGR